MLRLAVQPLLLPAVIFLLGRRFLGNGDALLVAALVHAVAEARRRWRCFQASAPSLTEGTGAWPSWPAASARVGNGQAFQARRPS
jgi:hypothetical protein